eukprot:4960514-Alexandrium_andersonii.AAC.1
MLPKHLAAGPAPGLGHRPQTRGDPRSTRTARIRPRAQTDTQHELESVARCSKRHSAKRPARRPPRSDPNLPQRPPRPQPRAASQL